MVARVRRVPAVVASVVMAVLVSWALASPASAHDPIFLTDEQVSPETGPYLPDGSISFAIYGSLLNPGETRGFEFDLRDGEELYLSLLIPDLAPETELADTELPTMTLMDPDGGERPIEANIREPFSDPFSGTDYVTLFETVEPVPGGRYSVVVTGTSPTRFVVAVGTKEEFFTPTERSVDRPSSFPGIAAPLNAWYTTPADGSEPVNADDAAGADEDVDIDVDLIEEELAKLEEGEAADSEAATDANAEAEVAESEGAEGEAAEGEDDGAAEAALVSDDADGDGDDGGGGTTWVAPVGVALAAAVGAGVYFRRRSVS